MFGTNKRLENLEQEIQTTLRQKDREILSLRRELEETRSWGQKWRAKAKFLRKVRYELTQKLKLHGPSVS